MNIFLISPVRGWDDLPEEKKAAIAAYVRTRELEGHAVHWPRRDTTQTGDPIGTRICTDNRHAMLEWADRIDIWYDAASGGSVGDIMMAFGASLYRPVQLVLANPEDIKVTPEKSFGNVILNLTGNLDYGDPRLKK